MRFTKMHGLGNDYLYIYGEVPQNADELALRMSDRHKGAGSDGIIWIGPSENADFSMRIFNADGSEAMMCGNGIRCVGKYVYDKGFTDKLQLQIETLSGLRAISLDVRQGKVANVTADMGIGVCEPPMSLSVNKQELICIPVSMGNPHTVFIVDDISAVPLDVVGPLIEKHEAFPEGVNAEFVEIRGRNSLRMRVWERGSGVTMACGTGACASAAAAVMKGFCPHAEPVAVALDGGTLEIVVSPSYRITMTGPAETVYEGDYLL